MTPSRSLPTSLTRPSSPNYDSLVSSAGEVGAAMQEPVSQEVSPADSAMQKIGGAIQSFTAICDSYPGIAEAEKGEVVSAMMRYADKVIGSLNSGSAQMPAGGGLAPAPSPEMGMGI